MNEKHEITRDRIRALKKSINPNTGELYKEREIAEYFGVSVVDLRIANAKR